ncbi:hypothetical protein RZS08_11890, partial [Arthrospira platensis SPKY1]|nr:hypothetical protein [Arthrospira platensis SPKY1]
MGAWTGAAVTEQPSLSSLRLSSYLPAALSAAGWEEDATPQIGYSGAHPSEETWAWISVEPRDMVFYLSSALVDGQTTVNLQGTVGLKPTGAVFIGLAGPFDYSDKTSTSITLDSVWAGGLVPA